MDCFFFIIMFWLLTNIYSVGRFLRFLTLIAFFLLNPFQNKVLFMFPQKTSEKPWFSDVLIGFGKGTLA